MGLFAKKNKVTTTKAAQQPVDTTAASAKLLQRDCVFIGYNCSLLYRG